MIDTSPVSQLAAKVAASIEEQFGEDVDRWVRTVALIVEVDSPEAGHLEIACSDDRPWMLAALLNEAWETTDRRRQALLAAMEEDDE